MAKGWRHSRWITFAYAGKSRSGMTSIWSVYNSFDGSCVGEVRWYGPWRKYAFFPADGCVFEQTCLRDLADYCEEMTKRHREGT